MSSFPIENIEQDELDAKRYRWLLDHAVLIRTDKQWMTMPKLDEEQKEFTSQLIDAELKIPRQ